MKNVAWTQVQRLQISRYKVWGVLYITVFALTSPMLPFVRKFVSGTILPFLQFVQSHYLTFLNPAGRTPTEQQFILQVLVCNLLLVAFSMFETFLRGGNLTRFDILASFVLGAGALANLAMFIFVGTDLEFLYFTCGFSALYVILDISGILHARKKEPEMGSTFRYSLAFVDGPTFFVCLAFLVPARASAVSYGQGFTDGIGAAILLFSGLAWTSLMVFFVAPRAGIPSASDQLGDALTIDIKSAARPETFDI